MIVVTDTGPVHYLLLIRAEWLLPQLFGEIWIPPAVLTELRHPHAPEPVRAWSLHLPEWAIERAPTRPVLDVKAGARRTRGDGSG